ncbi:hypothetical protein CRV15_26015 [Streptomyces clavuligerus]|uniref:Uncharacterized protein n=1 Tax=Streptomyces clavuligerus TaxID=1901 RepID=B5GU35_STRCL|nr:hypothetical protein D1794_26650 [Streptomyces clavuligerus]EDY49831.1 hypothetical protein SSCG_02859 [Streptomyces clavuligerus]EFG05512.1 Hypothetical protein SCLAV_0436 [Streptomyces clavuligerus]QCS08762.1 hypothetical protein CRV15_26015 [Streptomyces clavuligerus]QPJ91901.1 hypothetical protein GE265_02115 [Streptomyces clavuligerus]
MSGRTNCPGRGAWPRRVLTLPAASSPMCGRGAGLPYRPGSNVLASGIRGAQSLVYSFESTE